MKFESKTHTLGSVFDSQLGTSFQVTERQQPKKSWSLSSRATLSQEQLMVLSAVMSGKNVFFTGSAGEWKWVKEKCE